MTFLACQNSNLIMLKSDVIVFILTLEDKLLQFLFGDDEWILTRYTHVRLMMLEKKVMIIAQCYIFLFVSSLNQIIFVNA